MKNRNPVSSKEMIRIEKLAETRYGIPTLILMENAGRSAAQIIAAQFSKKRVFVLAGQGNNGGDGFVVARHLCNWGYRVEVHFFGQVQKLKPDAKLNHMILKKMKAPLSVRPRLAQTARQLQKADVVVDALFGTGLSRSVGEPYASVIDCVNQSRKAVVALDIPSGLDATSGQAWGHVIKADLTVAFGFLKQGHLRGHGPKVCGKLTIGDIALPLSIK